MTLLEMLNRYWWSIDDNATTPRLITKADLTALINQARKDLADFGTNISNISSDTLYSILPSSTGVITLPSNHISTLRIKFGDTTLTPIKFIDDAVEGVTDEISEDATSVTQYMYLTKLTVQLFSKDASELANLLEATPVITAAQTEAAAPAATPASVAAAARAAVTTSGGYDDLAATAAETEAAVAGATVSSVSLAASSATSIIDIYHNIYPTDLSADSDEPSELPSELHMHLPLTYARAQHALKLGRFNEYQALMALWEDVKTEYAGKMLARTKPEEPVREFEW